MKKTKKTNVNDLYLEIQNTVEASHERTKERIFLLFTELKQVYLEELKEAYNEGFEDGQKAMLEEVYRRG